MALHRVETGGPPAFSQADRQAFANQLDRLLASPAADGKRRVRALVLVPTRELAMQVSEAMYRYGHDLGARDHQHWREVAAERGVAALALRRHMAGGAAALQAERVRPAPPFALVVEHAARVQAQVAADGGDVAQLPRRPRDKGLGEHRVSLPDRRVGGQRADELAAAGGGQRMRGVLHHLAHFDVDDVASFDAPFFGISGKPASLLDSNA